MYGLSILHANILTEARAKVPVFSGLIDRLELAKMAGICASAQGWQSCPQEACLVYLTMAIGKALELTPIDPQACQRWRDMSTIIPNNPEVYYWTARCVLNQMDACAQPLSNNFRTVQIHGMVALYELLRCQWAEASEHLHIASRIGLALGFHDMDACGDPSVHVAMACNTWNTLQLIDVIVAACSGCPRVMPALFTQTPAIPPAGQELLIDSEASDIFQKAILALDRTLRNVYQGHSVPLTVGLGLLSDNARRAQQVPARLKAQRLFQQRPEPRIVPQDLMAALWLDLVENYGIMLASRPYMVHLIQNPADLLTSDQLAVEHMQRLSTSCLSACHKTIALLFAAWTQGRLPPRNHLFLHVLFCAAVLLVSNELLPDTPKEENVTRLPQATFILQAVAFMEGEVDGYAGDLLGKINMLRDAIQARPGGSATNAPVVPSNGNPELQPARLGARSSSANNRAGDAHGDSRGEMGPPSQPHGPEYPTPEPCTMAMAPGFGYLQGQQVGLSMAYSSGNMAYGDPDAAQAPTEAPVDSSVQFPQRPYGGAAHGSGYHGGFVG
ncbi:uncharacterized protein F5Z01DRAFT_634068 [Emericellopsis atlantica]|uniref:Transcription factor domain-containing protein n=1 Tax=Emericellopsis atlantica TaxID=2614577 RepID=A0A9P8CRZ7_9HYPO|nr:uncharacterized protein F5Z01DRAFT_634068 [Emericellopsis atlantica]KAG9257308.1 hypothetical protein F5Z01DRAFT_634068 [Emericellopsis atlantica]